MTGQSNHDVCDGHLFKWLIGAGLAWLEQHRETVNQSNVFPVPDGDTGTNMVLTLQQAYQAIMHLHEEDVSVVCAQLARAALSGARGNSGVILSQLLSGFSRGLDNHPVFDVPLLAQACQRAVEAAYQAVIEPQEGTILTVAQDTAGAAKTYAAVGTDLHEALFAMVEAARESLARTPDLLPILKRAGVVDSGGQGLVFFLEGMARLLHGESVTVEERPLAQSQSWQDALQPEDEQGYGYDVQFLMRGQDMDVNCIRAEIDAMGWSTLVVGDESLVKVHVHVHDPGQPLSYAVKSGAWIDDVVVENMQAQYEQYVQQRLNPPQMPEIDGIAVIAVANGDGFEQLFTQGLQAVLVRGGQTMNPSAQDFLNAIERLNNDEIILLPNNRNVVMAARQAATEETGKRVRVVPTKTLPQGINALLTYLDQRETADMDELIDAMTEATTQVVTVEITQAVRDSHFDSTTIEAGQYIGLVDGDLVSTGTQLDEVVRDALSKAGADEYELITLYYGYDVTESQAEQLVESLKAQFSNVEFEIAYGGQPLYAYVMSLE